MAKIVRIIAFLFAIAFCYYSLSILETFRNYQWDSGASVPLMHWLLIRWAPLVFAALALRMSHLNLGLRWIVGAFTVLIFILWTIGTISQAAIGSGLALMISEQLTEVLGAIMIGMLILEIIEPLRRRVSKRSHEVEEEEL